MEGNLRHWKDELDVWYWFVVVKIVICIRSLFVDNKKGKRCWSGMAWLKGKTKIFSFMARFNYLNFSTSSKEVRTRFVVVLSSSNRGRLLGLLDLMIQNKKE